MLTFLTLWIFTDSLAVWWLIIQCSQPYVPWHLLLHGSSHIITTHYSAYILSNIKLCTVGIFKRQHLRKYSSLQKQGNILILLKFILGSLYITLHISKRKLYSVAFLSTILFIYIHTHIHTHLHSKFFPAKYFPPCFW